MFEMLSIFLAILFVPSLLLTSYVSYQKGYNHGELDEQARRSEEERKEAEARSQALIQDPFFHGLVLDSIRENLGEDEI